MARIDQIDQTNVELWGIYNVLRSCYLNVLYYGKKASMWSRLNFWLQIGASLGSLSAISAFIAVGAGLAQKYAGYWQLGAATVGVF